MLSTFLKSRPVHSLLILVLRSYLRLALRTTRWNFIVHPQAHPLLTGKNGQTALVAFWHEGLILTPALWWWATAQNTDLTLHVLISRHRDGQLITEIVKPWRIWGIEGSSNKGRQNKGGAAAVRKLIALLHQRSLVAITPDGPKGPPHIVQHGIISLARLSNIPIVPVAAYCRCFRLKSWDRLIIPLPFGKGKFICDAPIYVTKANQDTIADQIKQDLDNAMGKALC